MNQIKLIAHMSRRNFVLAAALIVLIWMRISNDSSIGNNQAQQIMPAQKKIELDIDSREANLQPASNSSSSLQLANEFYQVQDEAPARNIGRNLDVPHPDRPILIRSTQNSEEEVLNFGQNMPVGFIDPLENFKGDFRSVGEPLDPESLEDSNVYIEPVDTGPFLDIPSSSVQ